MNGIEAARRVLEEAKHEEFVALTLVARALRQSKRRVLADWRRRQRPETAVGRAVLLPARQVVEVYFAHTTDNPGQDAPALPGASSTSSRSDTAGPFQSDLVGAS